eukprot:3766614-Alexandrium_andersonii.AAC.1
MSASLVGSEMCIRDRLVRRPTRRASSSAEACSNGRACDAPAREAPRLASFTSAGLFAAHPPALRVEIIRRIAAQRAREGGVVPPH